MTGGHADTIPRINRVDWPVSECYNNLLVRLTNPGFVKLHIILLLVLQPPAKGCFMGRACCRVYWTEREEARLPRRPQSLQALHYRQPRQHYTFRSLADFQRSRTGAGWEHHNDNVIVIRIKYSYP